MKKIERINSYDDSRFESDILRQHGAYLIDNVPCSFKIVDLDTARITTSYKGDLLPVINYYRFYTEHITKFVDTNNNIIKEFDTIELFLVDIDTLQPSQFYVCEDKLEAISTWLKEKEDVVIPLNRPNIIADGHSRLFIAKKKGIHQAYCYYTDGNVSLDYFVSEANNRGISTILDLEVLDLKSYEEKWIGFCEKYFKSKEVG